MSDGQKRFLGTALKKHKRLQKIASILGKKKTNESPSTINDLSATSTATLSTMQTPTFCNENDMSESVAPFEKCDRSPEKGYPQIASDETPFLAFPTIDLESHVENSKIIADHSHGSQFLGFTLDDIILAPVSTTDASKINVSSKVQNLKRIFLLRPLTHASNDVSGENKALELISLSRSSTDKDKWVDVSKEYTAFKPVSLLRSSTQIEKPVDVSPGFTPDSPFMGFTLDDVILAPVSTTDTSKVNVSRKVQNLKRIFLLRPFTHATNDVSGENKAFQLISLSTDVYTSLQKSSTYVEKSLPSSSECISPLPYSTLRRKSVDLPMTPILSKRKSVDFSTPNKKLSEMVDTFYRSTPNVSTDSFKSNSIAANQSESSDDSLSHGEVSTDTIPLFLKIQVCACTEYDYIQSVHECCCMSMVALLYSIHKVIYDWDASDLKLIMDLGHEYFNETMACQKRSFDLQPTNLVPSLTMFDKCYDIHIGNHSYFGVLNEEELSLCFAHFNHIDCKLTILMLNGFAYAIVICHFEDTVQYVLFDCHGRNWHGERFGEYTTILFFADETSLIQLLNSEFCNVRDFGMYDINFRPAFNINDQTTQDPLISESEVISTSTPMSPPHAAADLPLIPGQHFYKNVFGTFCQFSGKLSLPHHQCTAMSAAALALHSVKSVSDWNTADLDSVLMAGQKYYNFNLEHIRLENGGVVTNSQSYLEAIALTAYLEIEQLSFSIAVSNADLCGGFHEDINTFTNAIAEIERKKFVTVIITYRQYSYGLIRCARENNTSSYVFFDSHGRTINGQRPGDLSAVLFFNNAQDFIRFFLSQFPLLKKDQKQDQRATNRMIIFAPLIITCIRNFAHNLPSITDNLPQETAHSESGIKTDDSELHETKSDANTTHNIEATTAPLQKDMFVEPKKKVLQQSYEFIPYHLYADEEFYDILMCADTEEDRGGHSNLCVVASVFATIYDAYTLIIDQWEESDLECIFEQSCAAYDYICSTLEKNGVGSTLNDIFDICDICNEFEFNDGDRFTIIPKTGRTKAVNVHQLNKILKEFSASFHKYGILTICEQTYAVIVCNGKRGRLALYDIHGRTEFAKRIGKKHELFSTVLYFVHIWQLIKFLVQENEMEFLVHFYPIQIEKVADQRIPTPIQQTNLFHTIISGRLAQNDVCFNGSSRNNQCSANSVVFLAYTSLIKDNWSPTDIDRILYIGDHLYAISYPKAIKLRPRNDPYIAASEVHRKVVISTDGSNKSNVTVIAEPIMELSGNVRRFSFTYMERFFSKQIYGVFISSSKSVALYRFSKTYVLFDPHARNSDGLYHDQGTANIFLFENIRNLHNFLLREGYSFDREFTLTAFTFRKETKSTDKQRLIVPTLNLQDWNVPVCGDDFDSEDEMFLINLSTEAWSPDDRIPLIHLKNEDVAVTAKDLPSLRFATRKSQSSENLSVMSMPTLKRDGSSFMRPSKLFNTQHLRNQIRYAQHKKKFLLLPDEEQEIHQRWRNYLRRCERTKIPSDFRNANEYSTAIADYQKMLEESTDDQELIDVADAAVATIERNEERVRQRLHNRQLNPTHFLALCNHENVIASSAEYNTFRLSPMNQVCQHCKALYFLEERNSRGIYTGCCNNGKYHLPLPEEQHNNYPYLFRNLLTGGSPLSSHFMENILKYNNVFSFGSLGASDFSHTDPSGRLGVAVQVHGMIYHNAEYFLTNATGQEVPPAQLYYIDNAAAVNERNNMSDVPLNVGLLKQIEVFLRSNNPYAGAYRMLTEVLREVRNRPNAPPTNVNLQIFQVRHSDQVNIRHNHGGDFGFPTANEVAAVFTDPPESGTKNIVIFPSDVPAEGGIPIASTDPNRDSYLYPLLFPFGEQSWSYRLYRNVVNQGENARFRVTARDFYAFLFKRRHGMFSPLLNAGKLTQQFIIDAWTRVQENQMEYMKSDEGQAKLRAETYGALLDYIENTNIFKPDLPGRVIPMPVNFVGSRRYIKEKYLDAMAVCSKYKRPSYFITFTCNPFCKDITDNIPKGANPVDCPEVTSRAFQLIVDELVDDIKKKQVLGVCQALIYVIEWQKRANHHCHLNVFIQEEDRPANAVDVDNVVSAEIPCATTQPRLYKAVTSYMYHEQCGPGLVAKCMVPRKKGNGTECIKNFPKKFSELSVLNEGQPPTYRRRANGRTFVSPKGNTLDNRWIIPYNPYLLLKYDCHINIEIVSTVDILKYLFKYFYKGYDMSKIKLSVIDGEQVYDEYEHYVDCRHLTATEAYWRLDSFPIHYNDHTVYRLPVHLENYQRVIMNPATDILDSLERSNSELLAYFKLNQHDESARRLLYTEIPYDYVYDRKTGTWNARKRTNKPLVTRLYGVNYNQMELYALRLLLLTVKGARSYQEIQCVDGIQYDTFHSAAVALGLLTDDNMQHRTFEEICYVEMPSRIRCLFANLLIFITPNDPLSFWNKYKSEMCADYVRRKFTPTMAEQLALRHISSLLTVAGFSNTLLKLPEPHFDDAAQQEQANVVASEYLQNRYDRIEEENIAQRLVPQLNTDQKRFYDRFMHCVNAGNEQKLFFLDGPGGTGKTFLNRTLLSTLRGMGKVCTVVVWTGMGASLYKGGRTVHSTFRLPFDINDRVTCNISTTSDIGAELRQTDVLIWDEISMVGKHAFHAVDELFRDLKQNRNEPFGGIIVETSGDFRQTLPILRGAIRSEIVNNLVKRSNLWALFEKHALHINMRLADPNDLIFSGWLVDIGDGKIKDYPSNCYYDSYVKLPDECVSPDSLVSCIYGETFNSCDIRNYCQYALLTTHHEDVDMLNNLIYDRMIEDVYTEKTYFSSDSIVNEDPNSEELYDSTILNNLNPKGMASHKLVLKENCIVMLLRNLNPFDGFCNGTRLLVKKLYQNCVVGEIISGENAGKVILIPRIRMTAQVDSISEELLRIQFPVKLSFAMTIDKSQSQSFESVGLFLRKPPFSHGQLYVALSRTRHKANLKIQVFSDSLMGKLDSKKDDIYVPNIVYREAL